MPNPFKKSSSHYEPEPITQLDSHSMKSVGYLMTDFEGFKPNPEYSWSGSKRKSCSKGDWPIVVPKHAPKVPYALPKVIDDVLMSSWKATEPAAQAQRGHLLMGTRGMDFANQAATLGQNYHAQVRPSFPDISTKMPNRDAIASDWNVFYKIERTNAVCFRGDSRSPVQVFKAGGFTTPATRTDSWYLENAVYEAFAGYLKRRYGRTLSKPDFLWAVRDGANWAPDKALLIEYTVWRQIMESEKNHMGRMVENECLKNYISCSKAIDSSVWFGTKKGNASGWLYLAIVHGGFIVPFQYKAKMKHYWETGEAEIAQWGPIPSERIVGFVYLNQAMGCRPDGPIFIRKKFRKHEKKAFEIMFNAMSGWTPAMS